MTARHPETVNLRKKTVFDGEKMSVSPLYPLAPASESAPLKRLYLSANVCITAEYDGSQYYGYDSSVPLGSTDPEYTADGTFIYAAKFDSDGNFVIEFGTEGDAFLAGVKSIAITFPNGGTYTAQWDSASTAYLFVDADLAQKLVDDINAGKSEICMFVTVSAGIVIYYDYATILTGEV